MKYFFNLLSTKVLDFTTFYYQTEPLSRILEQLIIHKNLFQITKITYNLRSASNSDRKLGLDISKPMES